MLNNQFVEETKNHVALVHQHSSTKHSSSNPNTSPVHLRHQKQQQQQLQFQQQQPQQQQQQPHQNNDQPCSPNRNTRGKFRKFTIKVIEWIKKTLALGGNEVFFISFFYFIFPINFQCVMQLLLLFLLDTFFRCSIIFGASESRFCFFLSLFFSVDFEFLLLLSLCL